MLHKLLSLTNRNIVTYPASRGYIFAVWAGVRNYFSHASSARQLRRQKRGLCSRGNYHYTLSNGQLHALQPTKKQWPASVSITVYSTYAISAHLKAYEHGIDFKSNDIAETQFEKLWDLMRYSGRAKRKMLPYQESAFLQYLDGWLISTLGCFHTNLQNLTWIMMFWSKSRIC